MRKPKVSPSDSNTAVTLYHGRALSVDFRYSIVGAESAESKPWSDWSLTADALPFLGGTLCLQSPITRTPIQTALGTQPPALDCTGTLSFHFSQSYMLERSLPPGTRVFAQYFSRDSGYALPNNIGLTNALSFVICQ